MKTPMNRIRPASDLRTCFDDISRAVHETLELVFLTKDGYGDMVVMSMEAYETLRFEGEQAIHSNKIQTFFPQKRQILAV